jgi:hypothetical protein
MKPSSLSAASVTSAGGGHKNSDEPTEGAESGKRNDLCSPPCVGDTRRNTRQPERCEDKYERCSGNHLPLTSGAQQQRNRHEQKYESVVEATKQCERK